MNDALDDILTESGDEDEEQSVINQVLDEIGIEITSKVRKNIILYVKNFLIFQFLQPFPGFQCSFCSQKHS